MPLRARVDDTEVTAPLLSRDEWGRVRRRARADHSAVTMTCCAHPAQPRTSKLGLQHFAHRPGADCALSAGETVHHLYLKAELLAAAHSAGWQAAVEAAGEGWRADVLATHGPEQVAFEVQWSAITPDELIERSLRYADSGVRPVWLVRRRIPAEIGVRDDLPVLRVEHHAGSYRIVAGGRRLTVQDATRALLAGELAAGAATCDELPTCTVRLAAADCPACFAPASLPVAAPDEPPLRSRCGLPVRINMLDRDRIEQRTAAECAEQIRAGRLTVDGLVVQHPGPRGLPWVSVCGRCDMRTHFTVTQARRLLATADAAGQDLRVLYRHQSDAPAGHEPLRHWCLASFCGARGGGQRDAAPGPDLAEQVAAAADAVVHERSGPVVTGSGRHVQVVRRGAAAVIITPAGRVDARVLTARLRRHGINPAVAMSDPDAAANLAVDPSLAAVDTQDPARLAGILTSGGPRRSQTMIGAAAQHADVWAWQQDCWQCGALYRAVTAAGTWRATCGAPMGDFDLQDPVAAPAIAARLRSSDSPVRADVVRHRSKTTGTTDWVNRCPRCRAVHGRFFARTDESYALAEPPDFRIELLGVAPAARRQPHWCAGAAHCS